MQQYGSLYDIKFVHQQGTVCMFSMFASHLFMNIAQSAHDLAEIVSRAVLGYLSVSLHQLAECAPGEVLHDKAVEAGRGGHLKESHHLGMMKVGQQGRLTLKILGHVRVFDVLAVDYLHGDVDAKDVVTSQLDLWKGSLAQLELGESVVADSGQALVSHSDEVRPQSQFL